MQKKYYFNSILCLIVLALTINKAQAIGDQQIDILVKTISNIYNSNKLIPTLSGSLPNIDQEQAYLIQRRFIQPRMIDDSILGFKAGLTSAKSQKQFRASSPVSGVLLKSGLINAKNPTIIDHRAFSRLRFETEIGFILAKPILNPIRNTKELSSLIKAVVPVIEIVDLNYQDISKINQLDLIITNVAANSVIIGNHSSINDIDLNSLNISVNHNNQPLHQSQASAAMGDQWQALQWLINNLLDNGWILQPNQILITGALGPMQAGNLGNYQANFSQLGEINFQIK